MREALTAVSALDFSTVTELPGNRASAEQLSMIHTRYRLASGYCAGKDVLEAACGPGRGLGFLAQTARSVVGGDLCEGLVEQANRHYGGRIKVSAMDAQAMPWPDDSFDVVILYEALYYLPSPEAFLAEARRVLRSGGALLLCTANREWPEFNPSPFSRKYHSASELRVLLEKAGFSAEIKAGFKVANDTPARKAIAAARKTAVALGLVPKTMKGKALLKRIFYGRLAELGPEIDVSAPARELDPLGSGPVTDYKVLYAVAKRLP
ncbi:MAG: class I SAM-dependent methyltransferase [Elusimicrobia bacterium]|nr:class I SAM-dependent methyltransferase [Elusimicrobiota bacterium]